VFKLTSDQRQSVAEKIMEWGNLVFAGLFIGQFLSNLSFNWFLAICGILINIGAYILAILLMKGKRK